MQALASALGAKVDDRFRRPAERKALCKAALRMQRSGDFTSAFAAWEAIFARWPRNMIVLCSLAACARELGHLDYDWAIVQRALRLYPRRAPVLAEAAMSEARRGRWASSAGWWERVVHARKAPAVWCQNYVHNLLILGRLDEAERLAAAWRRKFPDHQGFMALQAMVAADRNRLDEALALWGAYRSRYPDDPVGWEHYGRTYQAKQVAQLEGGPIQEIDAVTREAVDVSEDAETSALLMGFESLGHNCEFGLVQRRFGAEPLGLLRFNSVTYGDLVRAAANGFAGMGEPANTELITIPNGEFFIQDRRWGLGMHTFVFEGQERPEALYAKLCRRVAYLRTRFLEDLAEGRKILVFTCPKLSRDDLSMLHRALRALGPVKLLFVAFGSDVGAGFEPSASGSVAEIEPGLFAGRLGRDGKTASGSWDIAFEQWVDICRAVRDLAAGSSSAGRDGQLDEER